MDEWKENSIIFGRLQSLIDNNQMQLHVHAVPGSLLDQGKRMHSAPKYRVIVVYRVWLRGGDKCNASELNWCDVHG